MIYPRDCILSLYQRFYSSDFSDAVVWIHLLCNSCWKCQTFAAEQPCQDRRTEYTHRVAIADFWRTSRHDGKISHGWWVWVVHAHPLLAYLPSRTKLGCTLLLRGQIHFPYFISTLYVLCGQAVRAVLSQYKSSFSPPPSPVPAKLGWQGRRSVPAL